MEREAFSAECDYVVAPEGGSDTNCGTESQPWATLAHAFREMPEGCVLGLRGGVHNVLESLPTPPAGTIIQSYPGYPGERATIDTSFPDLREVGVGEPKWEKDPSGAPDVYRTKRIYAPRSGSSWMGGFFVLGGERVALGTYRTIDGLRSSEERYSEEGDYYAGPGIYWKPATPGDGPADDGRIYIRLTAPDPTIIGTDSPALASSDPNNNRLFISYSGESIACIAIPIQRNHIRFRHLDIYHGRHAFRTFHTNGHHLAFEDVAIHAVTVGVMTGSFNHLEITDCLFDCHRPPWFSWNDVKRAKPGPVPGTEVSTGIGLIGGAAVAMQHTNHVRFENNLVRRCFDGVNPAGPRGAHDVRILNNVFSDILDDGHQINQNIYDVEIAYNRYIGAGARGIGLQYSSSPAVVGINHFHHNIIDATPHFWMRKTIDDCPPEYPGQTAFATHGDQTVGGASPWNIYNNTVRLPLRSRQDPVGSHLQYLGRRDLVFSPPHRVFNNIVTISGDGDVLRNFDVDTGVEIFDGNLYWRYAAAATPLLFSAEHVSSSTFRSFATLSKFRADTTFWCSTRSYYPPGWEASGVEANPRLAHDFVPAFDGPAGSGAVPLYAFGLPGLDGRRYRGAVPRRRVGFSAPGRSTTGAWSTRVVSATSRPRCIHR